MLYTSNSPEPLPKTMEKGVAETNDSNKESIPLKIFNTLETTSDLKGVKDSYLYSPKKLACPININGEICTHRLGKAIFGSENNVKALFDSFDKIHKHSKTLYRHIMKQIRNGDTLVVALQSVCFDTQNIWGPIEIEGPLKGFRKGIAINIEKASSLSEVNASQWLRDFVSKFNEIKFGKIDKLPPIATPCHSSEDYKKLFLSWCEAKDHSVFLSEKAKAAKEAIFTKTEVMWNEYIKVANELAKEKKAGVPIDYAKRCVYVSKINKLQTLEKRLLERWAAEVPTYLMNAKIVHGNEAVDQVAFGLCKTLDEIIGAKLFTESNKILSLKAYTRLAMKYTFKALGPIALTLDIISGIESEKTIPHGILRGAVNFATGLATWPVHLTVLASETIEKICMKANKEIIEWKIPIDSIDSLTPMEMKELGNQLCKKNQKAVSSYTDSDQPYRPCIKVVKDSIVFCGKKLDEWTDKLGDFVIEGYDFAEEGFIKDAQLNDEITEKAKQKIQNIYKETKDKIQPICKKIKQKLDDIIAKDSAITKKVAEDLLVSMKEKLQIPEDFFDWSLEKQAEWGKELASLAEKTMVDSIETHRSIYKEQFPKIQSELLIKSQEAEKTSFTDFDNQSSFVGKNFDTDIFTIFNGNFDGFTHCTPQQLAIVAELLDNLQTKNPDDQNKLLLEAAAYTLPSIEKINEEAERTLELAKAEKQENIAKKIAIAFDAITTLSQGILACVERSYCISERSKSYKQAQLQFETYMQQLGLDLKLSDFYNQSQPSIRRLLESKMKESYQTGFNAWHENAKEYSKAVLQTKQRLQECRLLADTMNNEKALKELAKALSYQQKAMDKYYSAKAFGYSKSMLATSIMQVAGSITSLFCPPVGAALSGASALSSTVLSYSSRKNDQKWQDKQQKLEKQRQKIAQIGSEYQDSRLLVHSHIHQLLMRQQEQRNFLFEEGFFQPLRLIELLKNAIPDSQKALNEANVKVNNLKTKLEHHQKILAEKQQRKREIISDIIDPTKIIERNEKNGKLKKLVWIKTDADGLTKKISIEAKEDLKKCQKAVEELKDLSLSIPRLQSEIANFTSEKEKAIDTFEACSVENRELQLHLKQLEKDTNLPQHHRKDAFRLSLEDLILFSDLHLKNMTSKRNSVDLKEQMEWSSEVGINAYFHAAKRIKAIQTCKHEDLSSLLAEAAAKNADHLDDLREAFSIAQNVYDEAFSKEKRLRQELEDAEGGDKVAAEEALAKYVDDRIAAEAKIERVQGAIDISNQLTMLTVESLMKLLPSERLLCCKTIIDRLTSVSTHSEKVASKTKELVYYADIEQSAEWELWTNASSSCRDTLFVELNERSHDRERLLEHEMKLLQQNNSEETVFTLQKVRAQLDANRVSRQHILNDAANDHSEKLLRFASQDNTNILESSLLQGHYQFLYALQKEGLPNQMVQLSSLFESLLRQLSSPEKYKERAIKARLVTSALSVLSTISYFYLGKSDVMQRVDKLKKEDPLATATGLLVKSIPFLMQGYLQPTMLGVSALSEAYNMGMMWWKGQSLPAEIHEVLQEIHTDLSDKLQNIATVLDNKFLAIQKDSMAIEKSIRDSNKQLQEFTSALDSKLLQIEKTLEKHKLQEVEDILVQDCRRIDSKKEKIMINLLEAKQTSENHYLQKLCIYAKGLTLPAWNGKDRCQRLSLDEMSMRPDLFIDPIGTAIQSNAKDNTRRYFVSPKLLFALGKEYVRWKKSFNRNQIPENALKVQGILLTFSQSLKWLCKQQIPQLERTSKSMQEMIDHFTKMRQMRLKAAFSEVMPEPETVNAQIKAAKFLGRQIAETKNLANAVSTPFPDVTEKIYKIHKKYKEQNEKAAAKCGNIAIGGVASFAASMMLTPFGPIGAIAVIAGSVVGGGAAFAALANGIECKLNTSVPESEIQIVANTIKGATLENLLNKETLFDKLKSFKHFIDITWIPEKGQLTISKIAMERFESFVNIDCTETTEKKHVFAPLLEITTTFQWHDGRVISRFHPHSWIQNTIDIEAIAQATSNSDVSVDVVQACKNLAADYSAILTKVDSQNSLKFKKWLGEYKEVSAADNKMLSLLLPKSLIKKLEDQVALELDLYTHLENNKKALQLTYSWQLCQETQTYRLSVAFCDQDGDKYFEAFLRRVSKELIDAMSPFTDEENSKALDFVKLLYLLYGEYQKVGLDPEQYIKLSSGKKILVGCNPLKGKSLFNDLKDFPVILNPTEKGQALLQKVFEYKKLFSTSDVFKEYQKNYHLAVSLVKLSNGTFVQEHHRETVDAYMNECGFLKPNSKALFDHLLELKTPCYGYRSAVELLNKIPKVIPGKIEALIKNLSEREIV